MILENMGYNLFPKSFCSVIRNPLFVKFVCKELHHRSPHRLSTRSGQCHCGMRGWWFLGCFALTLLRVGTRGIMWKIGWGRGIRSGNSVLGAHSIQSDQIDLLERLPLHLERFPQSSAFRAIGMLVLRRWLCASFRYPLAFSGS